MSDQTQWHAIILAAGRGKDDPMAKAFGVSHKCTLPIAGKPMLQWVLDALHSSGCQEPLVIVTDNKEAVPAPVGGKITIEILPSAHSAPASALAALHHVNAYPAILTTADHPLLTPAMLDFAKHAARSNPADIHVCLATAETILNAHPGNKRTFFNLGGTRVSGCNIFLVATPAGNKLLELWQNLERHRKKPWKLVAAFGVMPLVWFVLGMLTPKRAFGHVSKMLGIRVEPIFLPFAEAAIDVDKPSDHALAEKILLGRSGPA